LTRSNARIETKPAAAYRTRSLSDNGMATYNHHTLYKGEFY
jgi:hypothetical protein